MGNCWLVRGEGEILLQDHAVVWGTDRRLCHGVERERACDILLVESGLILMYEIRKKMQKISRREISVRAKLSWEKERTSLKMTVNSEEE
jgi:hypothetical protein